MGPRQGGRASLGSMNTFSCKTHYLPLPPCPLAVVPPQRRLSPRSAQKRCEGHAEWLPWSWGELFSLTLEVSFTFLDDIKLEAWRLQGAENRTASGACPMGMDGDCPGSSPRSL